MMRLTRRERLLAIASATVTIVWTLYAFAIKPATVRVQTLERVLPEKQRELEQLRASSEEYIQLRQTLADVHSRMASVSPGFELPAFLESLLGRHKLSESLVLMKPRMLQIDRDYSETIVEMKLENVRLSVLVEFLSEVESSDVLARTKTLHIQKHATDDGLLDSTVEIHSAKPVQAQIARN